MKKHAPIDKMSFVTGIGPLVLFFAFGLWAAGKLIAVPSFQMFKALNIVGLIFDLMGIVILSQFVTTIPAAQRFVVNYLEEQFTSGVLVAIGGLIIRAEMQSTGPSLLAVRQFGYSMAWIYMLPLVYFAVIFSGVRISKRWSTETLSGVLGASYLLVGLALQLYAAILDLHAP